MNKLQCSTTKSCSCCIISMTSVYLDTKAGYVVLHYDKFCFQDESDGKCAVVYCTSASDVSCYYTDVLTVKHPVEELSLLKKKKKQFCHNSNSIKGSTAVHPHPAKTCHFYIHLHAYFYFFSASCLKMSISFV